MLIVSLLLGALYTVLVETEASFEAQEDTMVLRQTALVAIDQLVTELRMAGFDIGNLPELIEDAEADRLAFVVDIDDGSPAPPCGAAFETAPNGGAERFAYRLQGGDLLRTLDCWDGNAWSNEYSDQPVAHHLLSANPLFRYYDADDNEMLPGAGASLTPAQRSAVRTIGIAIELEDPDRQLIGRPYASFLIGTRVALRNAQG